MIYWKTVDAGDYKTYSKKMLEYYTHSQNNFMRINTFWNALKQENLQEVLDNIPELKEGLFKFGIPKEIALLFLWPGEFGTLHTDHTTGLNNGVQARLQIPVLNTKGSRTSYFNLNERQYKNHVVNDGGTKIWPNFYREKLKPVSEIELMEPTIIRTSVPHTVYCDNNEYPRITMTISFQEDLVKFLEEPVT